LAFCCRGVVGALTLRYLSYISFFYRSSSSSSFMFFVFFIVVFLYCRFSL